MELDSMVKKCRQASYSLSLVDGKIKNNILLKMADLLEASASSINEANQQDIKAAVKAGLNEAIIDRLTLTPARIKSTADGLRLVAGLKDPVGEVIKQWRRPNGLLIRKVRVPIGVIFMIYESRPNVTVDSAGLCFKSGNCVILRGGKESINSNRVLVDILHQVLEDNGIKKECIQFIDNPDHSIIPQLLKMSSYIDLVIPRGGAGLIDLVVRESQIPVIKHYKGICHIYVDKDADLDMAEKIVLNAKTQRPGVCNAVETLLIHKDIAGVFLPRIAGKLRVANVELRGCPRTEKIITDIKKAVEQDWAAEYLALILAIRIVDDLDSAVAHINKYGSMHSDSIITSNQQAADRFGREVDSACVFVNASTRFSDGGQFGMGAEIGISTDKIHARGPMGLEELTGYKYVITGNGQIRE